MRHIGHLIRLGFPFPFGRPILSLSNRALNVAYNRFVARSPQFIMKGYGR